MALCLADSLVQTGRCDPADQMARYANWFKWGYWSSTGVCFDIGLTTKAAIRQFLLTGQVLAGSSAPQTAGNGSIMRLAPIALRFGHDERLVQDMAALSSQTTHGAPECLDACRVFAVALSRALRGLPKEKVLDLGAIPVESPKVRALAAANHTAKSAGQVRGSGYVVDSLEAALWCYARHDNFREAVLEAVNLGDDADTTGAIVGQLAGATFGAAGIPAAWLERLHLAQEIAGMADSLWRLGSRDQPPASAQP